MTDKQENRYSMMLAVQQVCNNNNPVWAGLPAFVTAFGNFETAISDIAATRLEQEKDLKGIAEDKVAKEKILISKALVIAKATVAYANVTNNEVLRQEVDYSESDLLRSRDTELETKCQIIHDRANTNSAALVAYGVTAGMITALATAITDYHATIAGPRSAISVRKTQTAELESKLKGATIILTGQMDQLVSVFETSAPLFVADYTNARIVVDLGGGPNTFTGTVAAGQTKNIYANAVDDAQVYEITNTGSVGLMFARGANGTDMTGAITVNPGPAVIKTALELGASGNKFLNVQNGNPTDGSYKVVKE